MNEWLTLDNCRFELLTEDEEFLGLGEVWIGDVRVRSGRLPLCVATQTFPDGLEFSAQRLLGVENSEGEARVQLEASFRAPLTKLMRDHSFDPIHDLGDWTRPNRVAPAKLELVLKPAQDQFNGVSFGGFSYHYEYSGETPLFFLLDKASWELDGDVTGATAYSQSSCSSPVATFEADTTWTTEGVIFFDEAATKQNPVMTHNLPRFASHGSFDFQFKDNRTLIGVFNQVDLIRSTLARDAGMAELKCFDKHIFDSANSVSTTPKKVLLNTDAKSATDQQNLWTWIFDEVHGRARAEFGLREEPLDPRLSHNYWNSFDVETYRKDLIPAAANIGAHQIFVDNLNESDLTEPGATGNMCCGQEYKLAEALGGNEGVRRFVETCRENNIEPYSWTNNDQSYSSPLNRDHNKRHWFVKMEDARLKYGGAYTNEFAILDFRQDAPRQYWVDSLKDIKKKSGLSGYLFDSFYNLGFMPVSYSGMKPTTQWRELLAAFKELQDADIHFMIESLGPFGQIQHGCPKSYNMENLFACYKAGMGNGYTTVPTGTATEVELEGPGTLYRILANMANPYFPLFIDGVRIDTLWTPGHHQALADFHAHRDFMAIRYLQEDGKSVVWHDKDARRATVWNFETREVQLDGEVSDATTGEKLPTAASYLLQERHTYVVTGSALPVRIDSGLVAAAAA